MSKFNVGDKVRYIGKDHIDYPKYYPTIGTIGKIIGALDDDPDCYIQWPKNSTSGNDEHWCSTDDIELVENVDMANEEIWKMLEPKMVKNGLKSTTSTVRLPAQWCYGDPVDIVKSYEENMVHNAIALAYKVGYLRAIKGRPFKVGEKKKGGHWEPVDPNNLPREGTKVRYSRESEEYSSQEEPIIALRDIGQFSYGKILGLPGIRFHDGRFWDWVSFSNELECLDMWVEDDE